MVTMVYLNETLESVKDPKNDMRSSATTIFHSHFTFHRTIRLIFHSSSTLPVVEPVTSRWRGSWRVAAVGRANLQVHTRWRDSKGPAPSKLVN